MSTKSPNTESQNKSKTKSKPTSSSLNIDEIVSPENKMSPEKMGLLDKEMGKPIIEMKEGETMPIFIAISEMKFLNQYDVNLMISIIYNYADKTIEMRGRIRYDATGNKVVLTGKEIKPFTVEDYTQMREDIRQTQSAMLKKDVMELLDKPTELMFDIDESTESIMKKMNDSNKFDIGVQPTGN